MGKIRECPNPTCSSTDILIVVGSEMTKAHCYCPDCGVSGPVVTMRPYRPQDGTWELREAAIAAWNALPRAGDC